MRFDQRWIGAVTMAVHGLAAAQPTLNPNDRTELTPQLSRQLAMHASDPLLRKAVGSADRAACLLSVWYDGEGTIQAIQIVRASGFSAIDHACFDAVIGQKLKPPRLLQPELGGWAVLPINWMFTRKPNSDAPQHLRPDPSIPAIRTGDPINLLAPYYPDDALARREHGICKMHVSVSAAGDVDSIEITQSTGSSELDQACLDAIYDATFVPATSEGKPVIGTTDIELDWRLPASAGPAADISKGP